MNFRSAAGTPGENTWVPSQGRQANVYGVSSSGNGEWVNYSNSRYAAAEGGAGVKWLVADQLGTPMMFMDQTGSLSGVRRHDYLPFGRNSKLAQAAGRQIKVMAGLTSRFTGQQRDDETGLDSVGDKSREQQRVSS